MKRKPKRPRARRRKISTTVARENYAFLEAAAKRNAVTFAEVIDNMIESARRSENRRLLAEQTRNYFANLPDKAIAEEREIESAMAEAAGEIDIERG